MDTQTPVARALWFIETHFSEELTLDRIAEASAVSRFHLSRAFALVTGVPVMAYVRGRRLSEAAKRLAAGAPDVLAIAVEAGYGSHEAFTRAFRDQFGMTPDALRKSGTLEGVALVEPKRVDPSQAEPLAPPRIETFGPALIAGFNERLQGSNAGIPAQWQRFLPYIGHLPGQRGNVAYGVLHNGDGAGNVDYLCGVEVSDFSRLPGEFTGLRLAERRYAAFTHRGHVSAIRHTWMASWTEWVPGVGLEIADAPEFERYDETFDPATGMGGIEIWLPLA